MDPTDSNFATDVSPQADDSLENAAPISSAPTATGTAVAKQTPVFDAGIIRGEKRPVISNPKPVRYKYAVDAIAAMNSAQTWGEYNDIMKANSDWLSNAWFSKNAEEASHVVAHVVSSKLALDAAAMKERLHSTQFLIAKKITEDTAARIATLKDTNVLSRIMAQMQSSGGFSPEVVALVNEQHAKENPVKPFGTIGRNLHDELEFLRSGGTKSQWDEAVKSYGSSKEYSGPYIEPTVKSVGGKRFMFYRNFSPKALDMLTPQDEQMMNVNVAGLKQARKHLVENPSDDTAQKLYDRELQTFNEWFQVMADRANPQEAAPQPTNAPASSATEKVRVKGPNGQTGTVPKGASLPEGWTLE